MLSRRAFRSVFLFLLLSGTLAPAARANLITYATQLQVMGMTVPSITAMTSPPPAEIGFATLIVAPISGVGTFDPGFGGTVVPITSQTVDTTALATIVPIFSDTIVTPGFTLLLTLMDVATSQSATLSFLGGFGGSVFTAPPGGMFSRITVNYTSIVPFPFEQPRYIEVGGTQYTVTGLSGGLTLFSNQLVVSNNLQVEIAQVPEPASLVLLSLGAYMFSASLRGRRKNGT
jgi:PEP-CTERM motif